MTCEFINLLKGYFSEPELTEICVMGTKHLVLFKGAKITSIPSPFRDSLALIRLCQQFASEHGKRLDPYCPSAGGCLSVDFRWHCIIPPACMDGAIISLRRHRFVELEINHFQISKSNHDLLQKVFANPKNHLVFCGPTSCGKTTLLSAYLRKYASKQRVIVIEELAELPLLGPAWIRLVARKKDIENKGEISLAFLIEESLRLRPDRIVLGEIRSVESLVFFESILLGHYGSAATIHGSLAQGIKKRIEALISIRSQSPNLFWDKLHTENELWYIFLERGDPPRIVGIEAHGHAY